ncbi:MAG: serine/threonine-protein phosphatase [Ktedonobacteraceae bacterium]|nr:serine/threonine-protein phosphatase [Ktedonobacteraceae bacterium]
MSTSTKDRAAGHSPTRRMLRSLRTPPLTFARYSVPHEHHPERNEDSILIDQQRGLAAVFDGVGSGPGRLASRLAARVIRRGWREALRELASPELDMNTLLHDLMHDAHTQICGLGERLAKRSPQQTVRPGTTAVLAAFQRQKLEQPGYLLCYAHVGDSRIYLLRPSEPLQRLTADDGYLATKVREGLITESDALRIDQATSPDQLNETELDYFEHRNGITQALGSAKPLTIHVNSTPILPGDRILLCSDGVHDNLTDSEIAELLSQEARTVVAKSIVLQSIKCSHQDDESAIRAKPDDMTAVVVTCNF